MKYKALFIIGLPMLLVSQAFACEADHTAAMQSIIAKSSTPENVKAVALHNKAMYCEQNAKNLRLQGDDQVNYVTSCLNKNDALDLKTSSHNGQKI
jgi:hypothetical protein